MIKVMKGEVPQYLTELFKNQNLLYFISTLQLRKHAQTSKLRTNCFKGTFTYSGAVVWNSLPAEMKASVMTPLKEYVQTCS